MVHRFVDFECNCDLEENAVFIGVTVEDWGEYPYPEGHLAGSIPTCASPWKAISVFLILTVAVSNIIKKRAG